MAKATPAAPTRTLERIPVDKITTGLNVRTDATPDDALVASIKANGILQPPTVVHLDNGDYEIVIGHRRANAAAKAGLKEIDALVIPAALAEEIRLVEQIVENEQRQNLTDAERAGGYKRLELFSISPAQIATRLGVKRDRVDVVLKVTGNEVAAAAVAEHGVPLDLAAQMVEFSDDKTAIKKLTDTATNEPARFDHVVAAVRREVELKAHKAKLQAELEATGVRRLKTVTGYMYGAPADEPTAVAITSLGHPDDPTRKLTFADIAGKEYAAGRVREEWMTPEGEDRSRQWAHIEYFVVDPDAHGIPRLKHEAPVYELSPEQIAANEERAQREREHQERVAKIKEAATVRAAWLQQMLQRTNLPDHHAGLTLWTLTTLGVYFEPHEIQPGVLDLLGITHPAEDFDEADAADLLWTRTNETPKTAERAVFAIMLNALENAMSAHWRDEKTLDSVYLGTLEGWGYGLSDIEEELVAIADFVEPETADDPEDDQDDSNDLDEDADE